MDKIILQTKNLSIGYGSKIGSKNKEYVSVQENLNLKAEAGKFITLLGGNGAGKSTLLRCLAGFKTVSPNTILWNGRSIELYSLKEQANFRSLVLTQKIPNHLITVEEVIKMGVLNYGVKEVVNEQSLKAAKNVLEICGLSRLKNKMIGHLSDGQKQIVQLARAIAQETPVIFLDEPTAYLDIQNQIKVFELLKHLCCEYGKTVIMATHNLLQAEKYADVFWLLSTSTPCIQGNPEKLKVEGKITKYLFE